MPRIRHRNVIMLALCCFAFIVADARSADRQKAPAARLDFAHRHLKLEWRDRWWLNGRDESDKARRDVRKTAFDYKHELVRNQRPDAKHMAAYATNVAIGSPWTTIGPRNINGRVKCLAVHPTCADIVYAGSASGGVWKTIDGGQSWVPLWDKQESLAVGAIAIAPSNPNIIYAATGEWTPGWKPSYPGAGLFVSKNAGLSWTQHASLKSRRVAQTFASPTDADTVYVAGNRGFEMSPDGGVIWKTLCAGEISDAVIDPRDAKVIYINVCNVGIHKTTNGGKTWWPLGNGAPTGPDADWVRLDIGLNGTSGTDFLVAKRNAYIYVTKNAGERWTPLDNSGSSGHASHHTWANLVAVSPHCEELMLVGGVHLSRWQKDLDQPWARLGGMHNDHHRAVFSRSDSSIVYACNDGGVYRSEDAGDTFKKVSHGMIITQFYDVGAWGEFGTVVGGGAQDQGTTISLGGLTWMQLKESDGGYFVIHPIDPRIMFGEFQGTRIDKSCNGGGQWYRRTDGLEGDRPFTGVITMDANNPQTLFTGTQWVFRTTNGCLTPWEKSSDELAGSVTSIAVSRSNPRRVYAATCAGVVIRSDNGGDPRSWNDKTAAPLPAGRSCKDVIVDDEDEDRVLVAFGGHTGLTASHVFISTNGGDSWTDISGNLPDISVNAAAFDPISRKTIYVGTDVGVFRSVCGDGMWQAFDNGIPNVIISDLNMNRKDKILVAATFGRGMYKISVAPRTTNSVDLYLRDNLLDTGERTPSPSGLLNPTNPGHTVFNWESPDIKIRPEAFDSFGAVFDGVEYDMKLKHEAPDSNTRNWIYLQVHNRGPSDATDVHVRAFVAEASAGTPDLPNALVPPAFDLVNTDHWRPVGCTKTIPRLRPNRPVIVSWESCTPASSTTNYSFLGVVSCAQDPIEAMETDIRELSANEKRVAINKLHVIEAPAGRPAAQLVTMDFHNAADVADVIDIAVRPDHFPEGVIGMLARTLEFEKRDDALRDVEVVELRKGEFIGKWHVKEDKKVVDLLDKRIGQLDQDRLYEFSPGRTGEIRGIRIGAKETLHAVFTVRGVNRDPDGQSQRMAVMQRQNGKIVGGSTFELRFPPEDEDEDEESGRNEER